MSSFASGKYALQICDRCSRRVPYGTLHDQIFNERPTGIMVCDDCLDEDHPQLQLGKVNTQDPQGLRDPRGENYQLSRGFFGWNPVTPITLRIPERTTRVDT